MASTLATPVAQAISLLFDGNLGKLLNYGYRPGYGVLGAVAAVVTEWTPADLFASSEIGVWFDPSDMTTLFQDAAGTTPVTALEQQVGLMLDKSGNGYHASQSTAASKATLSARYNLLTQTENFSSTYWTTYQSTVTANTTTAPNGTQTADSLTIAAGVGGSVYVFYTPAATITASIYAKAGTSSSLALIFSNSGNGRSASFTLSGDGSTLGVVTAGTGGTVTGGTATITKEGSAGWYKCTVSGLVLGASSGALIFTTSGAVGEYTYIWGASLVPADQASLPYQRVGAAVSGTTNPAVTGVADYDSDPAKFPWYLKPDGIDDWMSTPSIPFVSDKMTVVAGVRNGPSTTYQTMYELSANGTANNGTVGMLRMTVGDGGFIYVQSKGTTQQSYISDINTLGTFVLTTTADIVAPSLSLRSSGALKGTTNLSQGTGNFGTYPLYLFRRGGTTLPFNGHFYGLVIRGSETTAGDIAFTETFMAGKTGVTL